MKFQKFFLLLFIALFVFQSCMDDDENPLSPNKTDDVFELAVRRIKTGVSISDFTTARDAFVAKLVEQEGAFNDREVQPFFDYTFSGLPLDSVYIGMTQYEDLDTYTSLGQSLSTIPEAADFFSKFDLLVFEPLQPIEGYAPVDLAEIAPLGSGNVLEIAVRDLSSYPNFNQADYEAARDAFLEKLSGHPSYVREIQWQSATNPNIVVGMTVHVSPQTVNDLANDADFNNSPEATNFIGNYPPTVLGVMNTVLK